MPIHEPTDGFPGDRSEEGHHGGVCPLCDEPFESTLSHHLEWDCEWGVPRRSL